MVDDRAKRLGIAIRWGLAVVATAGMVLAAVVCVERRRPLTLWWEECVIDGDFAIPGIDTPYGLEELSTIASVHHCLSMGLGCRNGCCAPRRGAILAIHLAFREPYGGHAQGPFQGRLGGGEELDW